jgi:uncharacterized membrane protein YqjE
MLKDTILKFFKLNGFIDHLTGYVETRIQLMKYEIREEVAEVIANAILYFVLGVFIFIFILIGSIAAALFVGQEVGYGWGIAIVAGCYLVIAFVLLALRGSLEKEIEERVKKSLTRRKKNASNGNG